MQKLYVQRARRYIQLPLCSARRCEQQPCTDAEVFIPRFLRPPYWLESRPFKKKIKIKWKKRGQQLTSLWLNIKHTVGLHFVLQEEGQREQNCTVCQVMFNLISWVCAMIEKKKDTMTHSPAYMRGELIEMLPSELCIYWAWQKIWGRFLDELFAIHYDKIRGSIN